MRFNELHKLKFNCGDGAYSIVTSREIMDSQITLTGEEYKLVTGFLGQRIYRGNVRSSKGKAETTFQVFQLDGSTQSGVLNLVFPKPERDELRLYLRVNVFKPEPDDIWFIFTRENSLVVGSMSQSSWRAIGRNDEEDDAYQASILSVPSQGIVSPEYYISTQSVRQRRNPLLAASRFESVSYMCEQSAECRLFRSRSSGMNYLEAHHFIPLQFQKYFSSSLDVIENIVALCPFCHRAIHHADVNYTRLILSNLLNQREELANKFEVSMERLLQLYNCEEIILEC